MTMVAFRILAIGAASGRVGYVFLVDDKLKDWRVSYAAAKSPAKSAELAQMWMRELKPDVVVTEDVSEAVKKGTKTKAIIKAVAVKAARDGVLSVSVVRSHDYANKYEEAGTLAAQYPEIQPWLPQTRRFYDNEPNNTVLFEALSLADKVRRSGPIGLATHMG